MPVKVNRPVIVEGRYDRIRLSSLIDGVLIETGGFRIFRDKELLDSLRRLARTTGIILLTDSDSAGFRIRNFLKNALGAGADITHVYIPAVEGKERRKDSFSAEGLLGVEGMDEQTLLTALSRAGVGCEKVEQKSVLTAADLYEARLTGFPDSAARRRALLKELELPPRLSVSSMLLMLGSLLTREEFFALAEKISSQKEPNSP